MELSVRYFLDLFFIVEFLEFFKYFFIRLFVGGVVVVVRLIDRFGNVERFVWIYVIGRYIFFWKE